MNNTKSNLSPNLQFFKQKLLSGNGFGEYKKFLYLYVSLEDFQLIDNEPVDNSIIEREFFNVYKQQGANLKNSSRIVELMFGVNNIYRQIGNACLEFDITFRNSAGNFIDASNIRLKSNAFACCLKEAFFINVGWFRPRTKHLCKPSKYYYALNSI